MIKASKKTKNKEVLIIFRNGGTSNRAPRGHGTIFQNGHQIRFYAISYGYILYVRTHNQIRKYLTHPTSKETSYSGLH